MIGIRMLPYGRFNWIDWSWRLGKDWGALDLFRRKRQCRPPPAAGSPPNSLGMLEFDEKLSQRSIVAQLEMLALDLCRNLEI